MEDGSHTETQRRTAEEERGWRVSNKWSTIMRTPLPVFSKVVIAKGFKFFRKNTCRSVDSAWFIGALNSYKSNDRDPGASEGDERTAQRASTVRGRSPLRPGRNRGFGLTYTGQNSTS